MTPRCNAALPAEPCGTRTRCSQAWVISPAGLDLVPLCVTFLLCFWEVQYGIVAGVLVSGILLLYSIARPPIKVGFPLWMRWGWPGSPGHGGLGEGSPRAAGRWGAGCFCPAPPPSRVPSLL